MANLNNTKQGARKVEEKYIKACKKKWNSKEEEKKKWHEPRKMGKWKKKKIISHVKNK